MIEAKDIVAGCRLNGYVGKQYAYGGGLGLCKHCRGGVFCSSFCDWWPSIIILT